MAGLLFIIVAVSTDISNWPAFIAFFLIIISVTQIAKLPITTVAKRSLIEIPFIFFALLMPFFGNGERFGLRVQYSFDGAKLLGTGGAIKKALPLMGESCFVLYGDSYLPINFLSVQQTYKESGLPALMTVLKNSNQWDKSNVLFVDGKLVHTLTNKSVKAGTYVFNQDFFLILNVAMGGDFDGGQLDDSIEGVKMSVDYIRYYSINGVGTVTRK